MVSDASETSAFVYHDGQVQLVNDHEFNNFEKSTSSGHRELLAVIKTLESEQNSFFFHQPKQQENLLANRQEKQFHLHVKRLQSSIHTKRRFQTQKIRKTSKFANSASLDFKKSQQNSPSGSGF